MKNENNLNKKLISALILSVSFFLPFYSEEGEDFLNAKEEIPSSTVFIEEGENQNTDEETTSEKVSPETDEGRELQTEENSLKKENTEKNESQVLESSVQVTDEASLEEKASLEESPVESKNVQIVEKNVYPEGIFAKIKGYKPGDTVVITNTINQKKADVVIIGTLENQDEYAISLTPEAAYKLGIVVNSSNFIEIEKRDSSEKKATGYAEIFNKDNHTEDFFEDLAQPVAEEDKEDDEDQLIPIYEPIYLSVNDDEISFAESNGENKNENPVENTETVSEIEKSVDEKNPQELKDAEISSVKENAEKIEESKSEEETVFSKKAESEKIVKYPEFAEYVVQNEILKKGYYVQSGFFTNTENITKNFTEKYRETLPFAFVPFKNGYKVMFGPFTKERAAEVKAFMKDEGFSDSFIKQVK